MPADERYRRQVELLVRTLPHVAQERCFAFFIVYLVSHHRPIERLLAPARRDMREEFERGLAGMMEVPVALDDLVRTREELVAEIVGRMPDAHRELLRSIARGGTEMVPAGSARRRHSSRGGMADEEARTARREGAVCDGPAGRGGADGQDRFYSSSCSILRAERTRTRFLVTTMIAPSRIASAWRSIRVRMASALSIGVISTSRTIPGCGRPRKKTSSPKSFSSVMSTRPSSRASASNASSDAWGKRSRAERTSCPRSASVVRRGRDAAHTSTRNFTKLRARRRGHAHVLPPMSGERREGMPGCPPVRETDNP